MPLIKSLTSACCSCVVVLILLLGKIMPLYSCYTKKKLIYIIIIILSSCQPSFYFKCTKSNIHSSCDI